MKNKLLVVLIFSVILFGCSQLSDNAQADLPVGFDVVSKTERSTNGSKNIYELKHRRTGCYVMYSSSRDSGDISGLTQIMVKENGVSVPFCEPD